MTRPTILNRGRVVRLAEAALLDAPALRAIAAEIDSRISEIGFAVEPDAVGDFNALRQYGTAECDFLRLVADRLDAVPGELVTLADDEVPMDFAGGKVQAYRVVSLILGKWGVGVQLTEDV